MGDEAQYLNETVGAEYEAQKYISEKEKAANWKEPIKKPPDKPPKEYSVSKQWSHSRVDTFKQCPYKFQLRYLDKIEALPSDEADNALILGNALHAGIEKGVAAAIEDYFGAYPIITDRPYWKSDNGNWKYVSDHVSEQIKLEYLIPKAQALLPHGIHEMQITTPDFIGYVDLLVPTGKQNEFDLYDFKYTGNGERYRQSPQLHMYKHFLESQGKIIRNMYYLIIPKVKMIKIGKTEDVEDYRDKVEAELKKVEPYLMQIEFDYRKVVSFLLEIKRAQETKEFTKNETRLCDWCEYQAMCQKGIDYMLTLPKNTPVKQTRKKKTIWLYGEPYTGKTTFASQFPNHLFLTTDGNIRELITYAPDEKPPNIEIKDEVTIEGRLTNRKFAWEIFLDAIAALETQDNPFDTIILDHLGELYDHCRLYIFDRESIKHETDESYGKGWDMVKTEFLTTLKRLVNLDYGNIILISHEDRTKDISQKGGAKLTAIKPKLRDAFLSNIAGMVDITARTLAEDGKYTLSFKTSEVIFGGGRLKPRLKEIPLDYKEFLKLYDKTDRNSPEPSQAAETPPESKERRSRRAGAKAEPTENAGSEESGDEAMYNEGVADAADPAPEEPAADAEANAGADGPDEAASDDDGKDPEPEAETQKPDADPEPPAEEPKPVRSRKKRGES